EEAARIVREQAERARRERRLREVTRAEWRLRRAQLAHRPWGFGWLVDLVERRRESRAQEAIFRAGLADSPETVAEVLRTLQVMTLAPRFAGMDYSSTAEARDRKSTRLNSSHVKISYAVFCLKKKNRKTNLIKCMSRYLLS